MQSKLPMHLSPRCGARTGAGAHASRRRCRTAAAECTGENLRGPRGNQNALKHGRYTSEAIARKRSIRILLRIMQASIESKI